MKLRYDFDIERKPGDSAGVYYILNTFNNVMYIGQSFAIQRRINNHKSLLRSGTHKNEALQGDWNDFGAHHFEFGALVTLPDDFFVDHTNHHLLNLEQHFIKVYQTKSPIYGYNFDRSKPKKKPEKVYAGFFADVERRYDQSEATQ